MPSKKDLIGLNPDLWGRYQIKLLDGNRVEFSSSKVILKNLVRANSHYY
ncbi:hypothetical protein BVRB_5g102010 [Beta vulgaris subsp. vulgaris]|nr:hypothetical protein BVRB_5g102010 [Beta vulgaris subsp. vulgaris]